MNDAPHEGLDINPERYDASRAREVEGLYAGTRSEYRVILAIENDTGDFAGYTAIRIPDEDPARSQQSDTVTVAAHRNRGIGRWMKATMWQWLRTERPLGESLDTGNAESNRAMLNINEAMGFREIMQHTVWQKPEAD